MVINLCLLATAVLNSFTDFFFAPNATSGNSFLVDGVDYYNNLAITITRVMGDNCRWYEACIVFAQAASIARAAYTPEPSAPVIPWPDLVDAPHKYNPGTPLA